jgi:presqualene diphosphate synthase
MQPAVISQTSPASRASGSSFYLAMRILPREQREAMFEIYSFCKNVDDIADSDGARSLRLGRLGEWRSDVEDIYRGRVAPGLERLARTIDRFNLHLDDFLAIIEGMEMDVEADICAPDLVQLEYYCDRVASAVGRLSVQVFPIKPPEGLLLAHHLGRALQLTNILRDLDADAALNRLYLPQEALYRASIPTKIPAAAISHPAIGSACDFVACRAREHFDQSKKILRNCPRYAARAPKIMLEAYEEILNALTARGWTSPRNRIRVSRPHLLKIVLRHAFI